MNRRKSKAEAKEAILKAGMELTDDEVDQVAGGYGLGDFWADITNKDYMKDMETWKDAANSVKSGINKIGNEIKDAVDDAFHTH